MKCPGGQNSECPTGMSCFAGYPDCEGAGLCNPFVIFSSFIARLWVLIYSFFLDPGSTVTLAVLYKL